MDGLSLTIKKCSVPEGHGNCFPNAIVQQCRRPEINEWLLANKPLAFVRSHQALRRKVSNLALESEHKTLSDYRRKYENILGNSDRNWKEYWTGMGKEGTWVDSVFVQVTAWFIGLDIKILTTSSTPSHPFVMVNGDINDPSTASSGPRTWGRPAGPAGWGWLWRCTNCFPPHQPWVGGKTSSSSGSSSQ